MTIPQRERNRTNNDRTAPLRTPTHIGCAFSIDREFFYETGSYDQKMDVWGSENLEMAIRVCRRFWNFLFDIFQIQLKTFEKKLLIFTCIRCGSVAALLS